MCTVCAVVQCVVVCTMCTVCTLCCSYTVLYSVHCVLCCSVCTVCTLCCTVCTVCFDPSFSDTFVFYDVHGTTGSGFCCVFIKHTLAQARLNLAARGSFIDTNAASSHGKNKKVGQT